MKIFQTIALAALAILGHRSAHSFPMGPVIADPENTKSMSPKKFQISNPTTYHFLLLNCRSILNVLMEIV